MPFDTLRGEHHGIDAAAVVSHAQPKLLVIVSELDLDMPGMRVAEGIPERFRGDLVDLVTHDRVQIARLSLERDTERRGAIGARVVGELVAKGPDGQREIVAIDGGR